MFESPGRLIVARPWLTLFVVLGLSAFPVSGWMGARWATKAKSEWLSAEDTARVREVMRNFQNGSTIVPAQLVLEIESGNFFERERIEALQQFAVKMEARFGVDSVLWLGSVPRLGWNGFEPVLPSPAASTTAYEQAVQVLRTHPLVRGHLISEDGRTMLLRLTLWNGHELKEARQTCVDALAGTGIHVRLTGMVPVMRSQREALKQGHLRILGISMALVTLLAFIMFRGVSAIVVSCSGPIVGVGWAMGWLKLLALDQNPLGKFILPVMLLLIGFTDSVHYVVQIRQLRRRGVSPRDAAATAVSLAGRACCLTSLTTAIGFASLMFSDSQVVREFGMSSAFAVVIAFVAVTLAVPLASCSWLGRGLSHGEETDLVSRNVGVLGWFVRGVAARARLVAALSILVVLGLGVVASRLQPDDLWVHRMPRNTEAWQAFRHCEQTFGGMRPLHVSVAWPEEISRQSQWEILADVEDAISKEPLLGTPMSIRHWLSILPGEPNAEQLTIADELADPTSSPVPVLASFWNAEQRRARVIVPMQDLGSVSYGPVVDRLEQRFATWSQRYPGLKFTIAGDALIESQTVQKIIHDLLWSLAGASVVIFLVIAIAFRSLRIGLISLLPNVFPLLATAAARALFDSSLDIASACSFAICMGIAVDDTIHFLSHYQHSRQQGMDSVAALDETARVVGVALLMTTVVLVAGFSVVLTSELPTHVYFAGMAGCTIAMAFPGDLIILPAWLALFPGRDCK